MSTIRRENKNFRCSEELRASAVLLTRFALPRLPDSHNQPGRACIVCITHCPVQPGRPGDRRQRAADADHLLQTLLQKVVLDCWIFCGGSTTDSPVQLELRPAVPPGLRGSRALRHPPPARQQHRRLPRHDQVQPGGDHLPPPRHRVHSQFTQHYFYLVSGEILRNGAQYNRL